MGALLNIRNATIRYTSNHRQVTAVENVSFVQRKEERLVLLGPSGCGKSTLLKAIGGFQPVTEGSIELEGRRISAPGPDRMTVFQEFDQLFPWLTVKQNIVFALRKGKRLPKKEAEEKALHYIAKVGLGKFSDSYPNTLSGGMKQRVAIARAMASEPAILLMDEPFAALDALTRRKMQEELLALWEDVRFTLLFVTHSIEEAILIGHRILLLSPHPGRVKGAIDVEKLRSNPKGKEFKTLPATIHALLFEEEYAI